MAEETAVRSAVEVRGVWRRFDEGAPALAAVDLVIREGEFFSLLGPSGCGKTTLLRIIAGLDHPDEGSVRIDGTDVTGVPAHLRPVNTVFQSYALFPHLSVRDNVAFGLRMKRTAPPEIADRVGKAMDLVQISGLADRKPAILSGGQKQRVALARALVNEPKVLLLDEPLGALDLKLRKELQTELRDLQRRLGITFLCVTHDQEEALVLSDTIAVMRAGRIEQLGAARDLYERPRTRFVGGFLGTCNVIEATVIERGDGWALVGSAIGPLRVEAAAEAVTRPAFSLAIRPERVVLEPGTIAGAEAPVGNRVAARVTSVVYAGAESHYRLTSSGLTLSAVALNTRARSSDHSEGADVVMALPPAAFVVLDD